MSLSVLGATGRDYMDGNGAGLWPYWGVFRQEGALITSGTEFRHNSVHFKLSHGGERVLAQLSDTSVGIARHVPYFEARTHDWKIQLVPYVVSELRPGHTFGPHHRPEQRGRRSVKCHRLLGFWYVGSFPASVLVRVLARLPGTEFTFFSRLRSTCWTTNRECISLLGAHIAMDNN
jgi:hypothetical protein